MLAHMLDEMHKISYREEKSMVVVVYVLQRWAWEHLRIFKIICEDMRQPYEPYICRNKEHMTKTTLGKME